MISDLEYTYVAIAICTSDVRIMSVRSKSYCLSLSLCCSVLSATWKPAVKCVAIVFSACSTGIGRCVFSTLHLCIHTTHPFFMFVYKHTYTRVGIWIYAFASRFSRTENACTFHFISMNWFLLYVYIRHSLILLPSLINN